MRQAFLYTCAEFVICLLVVCQGCQSNLAFFEGVWPWKFWFGILTPFWPFVFGIEDLFGLNVIFWLFWPFLHDNYHRSDRMCAYTYLPLPYAHSLTNGYLLKCQIQCPVMWRDVNNMLHIRQYILYGLITTMTFSQNWPRPSLLSLMQLYANYTSINVGKSYTDICMQQMGWGNYWWKIWPFEAIWP